MMIFGGRSILFIMPLAAALFLSASLSAQAEDLGAQADAFFVEGKKLNSEGKTSEAEQKFAAAYALKPSADIACNLGSTEVVLKDFAAAATHLDECLRIFPATGTPEQKAAAEKRLAEARAEVTSVHVKSSVDGATILVDGTKVGQSPLTNALYLTPGEDVITAELEGHTCKPQNVVGVKQQEVSIALTIERDKVPGVVAHKSPVPAIVLGSVAAIGVGFGIVGVVVSAHDASDADSLASALRKKGGGCASASDACSGIQSSLDSKGTFRALGITGFVVGGAALIGTIVYVAVPAHKPADQTARIHFGPQLGSTNGVVVRGSF